MGFDDGHISLDSTNLCYYAGQTIFGKLEFTQDKVKTIRGIYVKVSGAANVQWTTVHEGRLLAYIFLGFRSKNYMTDHNAHEEYFHLKQYLVGSEDGKHILKPGSYSFPFQVRIPPHCPSSFEGKYGHIRYKIKVVVDRAFKLDQKKKMTFRVIAPLDLNASPKAREPIELELEKYYSVCCVSAGVVNTLVKLPVTGYVPGQVIPIEVRCENDSSIDIHNIKIIMMKMTTFYAVSKPGTKMKEKEIALVKVGPIDRHTTKNWTVDFTIPNTVDTCNVDTCGIINIDFAIKVAVNTDGCHFESSAVSRRIMIGTVPLTDLVQDSTPETLRDNMPTSQLDVKPAPTQYPPIGNTNTTQSYTPNRAPSPVSSPAVNSSPYPGANSPYADNPPPYPGNNQPYPGNNQPYPGNQQPYPGNNQPYPGNNQPYPENDQPYPGNKQPYPGNNAPYPAKNLPYPGMPDFHPVVLPSAPEGP